MKKIITILVFISMIAVAIPSVMGGTEDWPDGDCASDECNPAFILDTTNEATIGTTATVGSTTNGGGGTSGGFQDPEGPIIKCKWEYDMDVSIPLDQCDECTPEGCHDPWLHDACPCIEDLQVKPTLGGTTTIRFYAVVTDPSGVSTVESVYADVWHPDGEFKYQIELQPFGVIEESYDNTQALNAWNHAYECHDDLIMINEAWASTLDPAITNAWDDIYDEIAENMAYVYWGEAEISYCQPGGWYTVGIKAYDNINNPSAYLYNRFWYIPVAAIDIDFTTIDYGSISIGFHKQVGGDDDLTTVTKPTVRNIGNTPVNLFVNQSDMGFAMTGTQWNVNYDARMGMQGTYVPYIPYEETQIPGTLALCSKDKLDFGITADKGDNGLTYTGSMQLKACIDMESYTWGTPSEWIGTPPQQVLDNFVWIPST